MALKVLILRKKLTEKQDALKELERAAESFETREKELEADIEEAQTDEERSVVEEAVETFEAERKKNTEDQESLRGEVAELEKEIRETEETARQARSAGPAPEPEKRKDDMTMNTAETRTRFFGMSAQQRDAFLAREDVKEFLQRVRDLAQQKRSVTGAELLVPSVMLDIVREQIYGTSKLLKHVNFQYVPGVARQPIAGSIPEAVWTEMCATLNELDFNFYEVEVDGYMIGGFIPVCTSRLHDSDLALATELISAIGQGIGYSVDKSIVYGLGTKMPLGFVTRLAQSEKPSNYPATARPWADLRATHITTITAANSTGIKLFQNILKNSGVAKGGVAAGSKFWAMSETTYNTMQAEGLSINAAGVIVSGMQQSMPVVGGSVELLDFIPDNNIVGGYGSKYLMAEREGLFIDQSNHARFIQHQTVFKGLARYDGEPSIAEAFFAIGINGVTPATTVPFKEDLANTTESTP